MCQYYTQFPLPLHRFPLSCGRKNKLFVGRMPPLHIDVSLNTTLGKEPPKEGVGGDSPGIQILQAPREKLCFTTSKALR